jgi:hypothetical protein
MRVLTKGNVSEVCIKSDYIGSEPLRECLRTEAKMFKFPALSSGDFVNVALGVDFEAATGRVRALCD